jgi:glycosyltransferase involved in cell wall biosynthesis
VLTLVKGLARGGAESLVLLGLRHRDHRDFEHEVAYVSAAHDDLVREVTAEGVRVRLLGGRHLADLRWLVRLRRAMAAVDVVHAHSPVPAVAARLVGRTLPRDRRPHLVTTEHNVWASHHRLTRLAEDRTFGLDDAHLAVSEAVKRSLPATKGAQVEVVVQGVDLDAVRAAGDREAARRALGASPDDLVVGTVANLRPQKGYVDLLHAAATVLRTEPRARFVAIGKGPQEAELHTLHRTVGLGERFTFLGYRADAAELTAGFDVVCMASHHEGLPVALMEALALGVPVVATTAGGIPEVVTDGVEGLLVPPARPDLLAAALLSALGDETARKEMGRHAAERGDGLSVTTAVRRHEALYRALVGAGGG